MRERTAIVAFYGQFRTKPVRATRRASAGRLLASALIAVLPWPAVAATDAAKAAAPGTQLLAPGSGAETPPKPSVGSASGLPVPRYVSLKSGRINVRRGPGEDYPIEWVFEKRGLPVEVTAESDRWRRIRDKEGDVGWVWHSMLDGKRTAIIEGEAGDTTPVALRADPDASSAVVAYAEHGVIAQLASCKDAWCELKANGYEGWAPRDMLWGTYPGENFE